MINYKKRTIYAGTSDIARIKIETNNNIGFIKFGGDSSYKAYIISNNDEVPSHYVKKFTFKDCYWFKLFDDIERVHSENLIPNSSLTVYRAGDYGLIIQCDIESKEE